MADRDEILMNFQVCTGLENFEECIEVLQRHDWNLVDAINATQSHLETGTPGDDQPPLEAIGSRITPFAYDEIPAPAAGPLPIQPPRLSQLDRFVNFKVDYRGREIPVVLKDTETVGRIKVVLEDDIGVPAAKQVLKGWADKTVDDSKVLRDLHLTKDVRLYVLTPAVGGATVNKPSTSGASSSSSGDTPQQDDGHVFERLTQMFTLDITNKDNGRHHSINFPGSKTVAEVKNDVYHVTDIPVRHQVWTGWPDRAKDEKMTLAGVGIGYPCHQLEICRSAERKTAEAVAMELEISDEEFEDASESFPVEEDIDFDTEEIVTKKPRPLIPDQVDDDATAVSHFSIEFSERYGDQHPVFYIGSLDDAIKDALLVKAKERKLLAVYLHHDGSILANIFCSQILCADSVVGYLSQNFVIWPWDMTTESNRNRLLAICTQHFGSMAVSTVKNFQTNQMPLLLIVTRNRSTNEVFTVIQGNVTLEELMTNLINAVDVFTEQQTAEIREEQEREDRELVKSEQDQAYQESLAVDRAKSEAKRAQEEEERMKLLQERQKQEIVDRQKKEEDDQKEAIRLSIADGLPDEPSSDCQEPVSVIRLRAPTGENMMRRFLVSAPLQQVLHYIITKGYHLEDYKVLTTYPRRDLTSIDESRSLHELKLYPQETLILEER